MDKALDRLKAQLEELRHQVEQTRILAESTVRHADAAEDLAKLSEVDQAKETERISAEAQPVFVPEGGSSGGAQSKTTITNHGAEVVRVRLEYDGAYDLSLADRPSLIS